jgi:exonuclease V gamma subunit
MLSLWSVEFLGEGTGAVSEQRTHLINTLIPNLRSIAPDSILVQSDAVLRLVEAALRSLNVEHGASAGGVTVADLQHYAGTPARLVAVVGLGADVFPRHEDRPDWHPLATNREPGDPDTREADRHALLLALLSASERLVLAYQGGSDEDARERPPSTPVADLLAAVDEVATLPGGVSAAQNIHIRHGLNGFSPSACAKNARAVERSQIAADYAGAAVLQGRTHSDSPGLWSEALEASTANQDVTFRDLNELFREPCRVFVRRLGLQIPEEASELSQADALDLDGLSRWSLRDQLLRSRIAGSDEQKLLARLEAAGDRPRGQYGHALWHQSVSELPAIDEGELSPFLEPLQLVFNRHTVNATLPDGWFLTPTGSVVYCSASTRSRKQTLSVTLGLLCLAAAQGITQAQTWFRNDRNAKIFLAPDPAVATKLLEKLLRLYDLAQHMPLPFWPEAYDRICRLVDNARTHGHQEPPRDALLSAAWSTWTLGAALDFAGPPESKLPATRVCFRGLSDPFTWTPPLSVDWLPGNGEPLAWRLYRFVSEWESTAKVSA